MTARKRKQVLEYKAPEPIKKISWFVKAGNDIDRAHNEIYRLYELEYYTFK